MAYDEAKVIEVLQSVFGYENFLNATQKDAITTIVEGKQSVCISMPPGSGRSLCFQLPAIVQRKIAVIISPKLSVMKKQVEFLRSKHINACLLHKGLYPNKKESIINDLTSPSPTVQLLYVTVDMAVLTYVQKMIILLKRHNILSYIVFNEAHCLSTLGYEYIAIYERINMACEMHGGVPRIAVTTTVTSEVIKDICNLLMMKYAKIIKLAVQQNKVFYDIEYLDMLIDPFRHLINFIKEVLVYSELSVQEIVQKGCAVIYCREEQTAELLMNKLNTCGIPTLTCHHKLRQNKQRSIENHWTSGKACVITTTYSYGFIYKNLIRCIVYWTIPENISKYYRESMQIYAFNDQPHCRVYFSMKEYLSMRRLIENRDIMKGAIHTKQRLIEYDKFITYCLSIKCRHMLISEYFGFVTSPCERYCDTCTDKWTVQKTVDTFLTLQEIKYNIHEMNEDLSNEKTDCEKSEVKNENKQLLQCTDKISTKNAIYSAVTLQSLEDQNNLREENLRCDSSRDLLKKGTNFEMSVRGTTKLQCNIKASAEDTVYSTSTSQSLVNESHLGNDAPCCEICRDFSDDWIDCKRTVKDNTKQIVSYNEKSNVKDTVYSTSSLQPFVEKSNLRKAKPFQKLETSTHDVQKLVKRTNYFKNAKRRRMKALNINKIKVDGSREFSSSRNPQEIVVIEIDSDDEPVIEIEKTRDKRIIKEQSRNQVKNDSNVKDSRDNAIVECLIKKYNLNTQAITLEIREK